MKRSLKFGLGIVLASLIVNETRAVILFGRNNPNDNTRPPTQAYLKDSGWQYMGWWGNFCGVPISSRHFLAAKHVGGITNQSFWFWGQAYTTISVVSEPAGLDLNIWKISGIFPTWAPLWVDGSELGKTAMIIGRGTQKGAPVYAQPIIPPARLVVNSATSPSPALTHGNLAGWFWGPGDAQMRWGTNTIISVNNLLMFQFTGDKGADEAALSNGDSSGAAFIQGSDGNWKLAGILGFISGYGPYSSTPTSPVNYGVFFDVRGLWDGWSRVDWTDYPQPSTLGLATRVASSLNWIWMTTSQP